MKMSSGNTPTSGPSASPWPPPSNPVIGRWRIIEMSTYADEHLDERVEPYIEIREGGAGSFAFWMVFGLLTWEAIERDGRSAVEFNWQGSEVLDATAGKGWAALNGQDELRGEISFWTGDGSTFQARRGRG
jgi:hypothetical protein